jgi:hypothetical protein
LKSVADGEQFEQKVGINTLDCERSIRTGGGSFPAVDITTRAKGAVTFLDSSVVHKNSGMVDWMSRTIENCSGQCYSIRSKQARCCER